jgi:hypothetical protein
LGTSPFPDHVAFLQRSMACGLAGTAHIAVPAGRRTRLLSTVPGLRKPTEKTGFRPNGPARRSSANFRPLSDGRAARTVLLVMPAVLAMYLLVGNRAGAAALDRSLGPFTKMVPLLVATLFTLAILDER